MWDKRYTDMTKREKKLANKRSVKSRQKNGYHHSASYRASQTKWRRNNPKGAMLRRAKSRAVKFGVPFALSKADFEIPSHCPVLGIKLVLGVGKPHDASPSLDRIKPELGYVPGNVSVISHRANRIKYNCKSGDELRKIADYIDKGID